MIELKCQVEGCNGKMFIRYGDRWICGDCMAKIIKKKQEKQEREIKELERDLKCQ